MSDDIEKLDSLYDEVVSIIGEERPVQPAFANEDPEGWWNALRWEEKATQALTDLLMVERRKNQKLQAENAELKKQGNKQVIKMDAISKFLFCFSLFLVGYLSAIVVFENNDSRIIKIKSEKALCEKELKRTERCEIESFNFKIVNKD